MYDRSDQHLPFLDFRTFAMRVLFPHDTDHVVLQPLTVSGSSRAVGCGEGEEPACTNGCGSLYVMLKNVVYTYGCGGEGVCVGGGGWVGGCCLSGHWCVCIGASVCVCIRACVCWCVAVTGCGCMSACVLERVCFVLLCFFLVYVKTC